MICRLPLVCSTLLLSFQVFADTEPPSKTVVLLIAAEQFIGSEDAVAAVRSQLSDLPVRFEIERLNGDGSDSPGMEARAREIADKGDVAAVIWLDPENSGRIHFLLTDEKGSNIFDRGLQEGALAPVQTESLALILRATVQALIEGELDASPPIQDESSPPEEKKTIALPAPEPVPIPTSKQGESPPEDPPLFGLETAYAYRAYSTDMPAISGFHVGLHLRLGAFVRVFLEYEFRQPLTAPGSCVKTTVRPHPITAGGRLLFQRWRFLFGPTLGITVDIATYDSETSCYRIEAFDDRYRINVSAAAGFFVAARIYKRLSLFLSAEADIMWRAARYTAPSDTGEKEVLLNPWRVQPAATIGLSVEVI
ncbi:MAG: hypothetical protein GY854_20295 [Deltaproteobacteria bacterium]|nr:hypothetical protein [Deltaproteobacteria bacterium]